MKRPPIVTMLSVLIVAVCAIGVSACGGGSKKTSSRSLIIGRTADIDTLDPYLSTAFQTEQTLELIYGGLTQLDASSTWSRASQRAGAIPTAAGS